MIVNFTFNRVNVYYIKEHLLYIRYATILFFYILQSKLGK